MKITLNVEDPSDLHEALNFAAESYYEQGCYDSEFLCREWMGEITHQAEKEKDDEVINLDENIYL